MFFNNQFNFRTWLLPFRHLYNARFLSSTSMKNIASRSTVINCWNSFHICCPQKRGGYSWIIVSPPMLEYFTYHYYLSPSKNLYRPYNSVNFNSVNISIYIKWQAYKMTSVSKSFPIDPVRQIFCSANSLQLRNV